MIKNSIYIDIVEVNKNRDVTGFRLIRPSGMKEYELFEAL